MYVILYRQCIYYELHLSSCRALSGTRNSFIGLFLDNYPFFIYMTTYQNYRNLQFPSPLFLSKEGVFKMK